MLFACEAEQVDPDLMTVAKGLTAGYAPMGAVLMSDEIYEGIAGDRADSPVVGHGHTYSAHPVSAAIGLEVLKLYHEGGLLANGRRRRRASRRASTRCARIRSSATRVRSACSARSNWWPTRRTRRASTRR